MSTTRRKTAKSAPAPSESAIGRRAREVADQEHAGRRELADMWLARLQAIVTPRMIEDEGGDIQAVYKECLTLEWYQRNEAAALHRRLSQVIARELWDKGTFDSTPGRVLNALRAFLKYSDPNFRPGWDSWTGSTK